MKEKVSFGKSGPLHMGLPCDAVIGLPLVELYGNHRVLIENHSGVKSYCARKIIVRTKISDICIVGDKLEIANMSKCRLIITGEIESVLLTERR